MRHRTYGTSGPPVVLLHGGPGAPGHMAALAEELADRWRVLEPFQRHSGDAPLTVARHVEDLRLFLDEACGGRAILVGSSWGAMLGLVHAARHPEQVRGLVLVGCGTFDARSRAALHRRRNERLGAPARARLEQIAAALDAPGEGQDELFHEAGDRLGAVDVFDALPISIESEAFDYRGHTETWGDAMRMEQEGETPALFARIRAPVLMLHGAYDTHPGGMIRDVLLRFIPHLAYREFERCGHYPWIERHARAAFLAELRAQLAAWGD